MPERDLHAGLAERDRFLRQVATGSSRARVRRRLDASIEAHARGPARRHVRLALAVTGTAVGLACAVLIVGSSRGLWRTPAVVGGFVVSEARGLETAVGADQSIAIQAGHGRLTDGDMSLEVSAGTRLRREARGVRLIRGAARFTVRARRPAEGPARVLVSRGSIEVLGTRFTVIQRELDGEVTLHEGSIRFVTLTGTVVPLMPGQSHRWPEPEPAPATRPVAPEAAPAAPSPPPSPPKEPGTRVGGERLRQGAPTVPDVGVLLARVAELRDQRRYAEAARVLEHALRRPLDAVDAERLSYELGTILTDRLTDRTRACRHWDEHGRRFGRGRYAREVTTARVKLHCGGDF